jgi:hypothetical protein
MLRFPKNEGYLVPEGIHPAICYCIAELGTQETSFGDKPQVHIGWEVPEERLPDGRVAVVSRRYSVSAHQKSSLRGDIEKWQGRRLNDVDLDTFDFNALIGQTCQVSIQHSDDIGGRIYANVAGVMPPSRGTAKRVKTENPPIFFEFGSPNQKAMYDLLPNFLRTAIARSPEYAESMSATQLAYRNAEKAGAPAEERLDKAKAVLRERLQPPRVAPGTKSVSDGLPDDDLPWQC